MIYHDQAVRAEKKGALDKSTVLYEPGHGCNGKAEKRRKKRSLQLAEDKAALYWNQALRTLAASVVSSSADCAVSWVAEELPRRTIWRRRTGCSPPAA